MDRQELITILEDEYGDVDGVGRALLGLDDSLPHGLCTDCREWTDFPLEVDVRAHTCENCGRDRVFGLEALFLSAYQGAA